MDARLGGAGPHSPCLPVDGNWSDRLALGPWLGNIAAAASVGVTRLQPVCLCSPRRWAQTRCPACARRVLWEGGGRRLQGTGGQVAGKRDMHGYAAAGDAHWLGHGTRDQGCSRKRAVAVTWASHSCTDGWAYASTGYIFTGLGLCDRSMHIHVHTHVHTFSHACP